MNVNFICETVIVLGMMCLIGHVFSCMARVKCQQIISNRNQQRNQSKHNNKE